MKQTILMLFQRIYLFMVRFCFLKEKEQETQILLIANFKQMRKNSLLPLNFEDVGFNVYSATDEDGILLYIFSIIGMTSRLCVDIGAGTLRGSNTANLIINHGFSGLLIEGNRKSTNLLTDYYSKHPNTKIFPPTLLSEFVTAENINDFLITYDYVGTIDLLSIDIDGIDYWVWNAIDKIKPRVVVVEYNDALGPDKALTVPYDPLFNVNKFSVNKGTFIYCGASLKAFAKLGEKKGYRLVGCNRGGWNAFFVKNGLGEDFLPEVTTESCFKSKWNQSGLKERFPLVKDMPWEEV